MLIRKYGLGAFKLCAECDCTPLRKCERERTSNAYHYAGLLFSKKQYVTANITITHTSLQRERRADRKKLQTQKRREETTLVAQSSVLFFLSLRARSSFRRLLRWRKNKTRGPRLLLMNHNDGCVWA
jgi:hypothetical protein